MNQTKMIVLHLSQSLYAPKHCPNWNSITNFEINLNWMELKVSSFFSFNLSYYIVWISLFLLFYTIRFPSAILFRQMMKAQNVSCFGDCSNTLIRISLFHWSNPKRSRRFSLLISLTMFINLKACLLAKWLKMSNWSFVLFWKIS